MTSNLIPQELEALLALMPHRPGAPAASEVSSRDFRRPNRLSANERDKLRETLARLMPEIERDLRAHLRHACEAALGEVSEINCEELFAELAPPFAIARFEVKGEPGWIVWDIAAAVAAVELALGTDGVQSPTSRALSSVEKTMLKRLFAQVLGRIARPLKLELKDLRVADIVEQLGSWRDGGDNADARRLLVHLALTGPGGDSTLAIYLPGVVAGSASQTPPKPPSRAPDHLAAVPFEVSARLGCADVPLADLLGLEIGDVIPLFAATDEPLRLVVEDRVCAAVRLGSHDGNLAIRVESLRPPGREE